MLNSEYFWFKDEIKPYHKENGYCVCLPFAVPEDQLEIPDPTTAPDP